MWLLPVFTVLLSSHQSSPYWCGLDATLISWLRALRYLTHRTPSTASQPRTVCARTEVFVGNGGFWLWSNTVELDYIPRKVQFNSWRQSLNPSLWLSGGGNEGQCLYGPVRKLERLEEIMNQDFFFRFFLPEAPNRCHTENRASAKLYHRTVIRYHFSNSKATNLCCFGN